jgi:hypothetical protein
MLSQILGNPKFFFLLFAFDKELARMAIERRCPMCGEALHVSNFQRKPRGGPAGLPKEQGLRFSLCCSKEGCRKRLTPASFRFLGRRVYFGAVLVLVSAMMNGVTPRRRQKLHDLCGADRRTLQRWRDLWEKEFPKTSLGRDILSRQSIYPRRDESIPRQILRSISEKPLWKALLRFLYDLLPLTGRVSPDSSRSLRDAFFHAEDACFPLLFSVLS